MNILAFVQGGGEEDTFRFVFPIFYIHEARNHFIYLFAPDLIAATGHFRAAYHKNSELQYILNK